MANSSSGDLAGTDLAAKEKLSLVERVQLLAADVQKNYRCTISITQNKRAPDQAQEFHVCHMFLYNLFPRLRPTHLDSDGRTIAWDHFSRPDIDWRLIKNPSKFLRTASGDSAKKEQSAEGSLVWVKGYEPDLAASVKAMVVFLRNHHVAKEAAPGINGCGEPCGCGSLASKHITGDACDVKGMEDLQKALAKENDGKGVELDDFLKGYGLHRPLAHIKKSERREPWHLEAWTERHAKKKPPSSYDGTDHPLAKHAGLKGMIQPGKNLNFSSQRYHGW